VTSDIATDRRYYDEEAETRSRADIDAMQLGRLQLVQRKQQ
jgi:hypothetical protein